MSALGAKDVPGPSPDGSRGILDGEGRRVPRAGRLVVAAAAGHARSGGRGAGRGEGASLPPRAREGPVLRDAQANRVIVVLKTQHRGRLASAASVRARAGPQARERHAADRPRQRRPAARSRASYTILNALRRHRLGAHAQQRLGSRSARRRGHPRRDGHAAHPGHRRRAVAGTAAPSPGNPTTPQSGDLPDRPGQAAARARGAADHAHRLQGPDDPAGRRTWPRARASRSRSSPTAWTSTTRTSSGPDGSHVFIDYRDFTGDGPERAVRRRRGVRRRELDRRAGPPGLRPVELRQPRPPAAARAATSRVRGVAPGRVADRHEGVRRRERARSPR